MEAPSQKPGRPPLPLAVEKGPGEGVLSRAGLGAPAFSSDRPTSSVSISLPVERFCQENGQQKTKLISCACGHGWHSSSKLKGTLVP